VSREPCPNSADLTHAIPETPLSTATFATAGQAAGVAPAQFPGKARQRTLLKRLPALAEIASTAAFIASDRAGAMTATVANLPPAASPSCRTHGRYVIVASTGSAKRHPD
jgi:3-oxoacyl-[acyl-carrier protein] reductase